MADSNIKHTYQQISLTIFWAAILLFSESVLAKSRVPISDSEIREKKNECYADIESWKKGRKITRGVRNTSTACTGYLLERVWMVSEVLSTSSVSR